MSIQFIIDDFDLAQIIGSVDKALIPRFKRTKAYIAEDYELLVRFLGLFPSLLTLPNILTEVSNLANSGGLAGAYRDRFFEIFARTIQVMDEHYLHSAELVDKAEFRKFGLTDAALYYAVQDKYLVLTDYFPIAQYLHSNNKAVVNFNHIRMLNW